MAITAAKAANTTTSTPPPVVVAIMTCGRIAPCFGPAVGGFLQRYRDMLGDGALLLGGVVQLVAYRHGYRGVLSGDKVVIGEAEFNAAGALSSAGGSPIGGSRTRLSNKAHLIHSKLIADETEDPMEKAAQRLMQDNVRVLHVIGSADAQITAGRLSSLMGTKYHYTMHLIGLAKTIENDMFPIRMTLGAQSAAEEGASYFENVVAEHNSNPRMLIIHEIKGRAAGWLVAATARAYRRRLDGRSFPASFGQAREVFDVHAVYMPETKIDFPAEIGRLRRCMDRHDNVNIFVAQGTGLTQMLEEHAAEGKVMERHPTLGYPVADTATWLAGKLKDGIGAEKVLIQRSGVYVRAASANAADTMLVESCVHFAVDLAMSHVIEPHAAAALRSRSGNNNSNVVVAGGNKSAITLRGVVGHDERHDGELRLVELEPLMKKQAFDTSLPWFVEMMASIGQPQESAGMRRWRHAEENRQQRLKQQQRQQQRPPASSGQPPNELSKL